MLAAAVVPHPPLLVPALAAGGAPAVAPLLAACDAVVAELVAQLPEIVVLVGTGARTARHRKGSWGTLAGFGVEVPPTDHRQGLAHLPPSLTIARWLLDRVGYRGPTELQEVAADEDPATCAALGARLAAENPGRSAWLVAADGSTGHGARDPADEAAGAFDLDVAHALSTADAAALAGLDPALAGRVGATGRAAWQVLAAAVTAVGTVGERVARAELRHDAAPFGTAYYVAAWRF